MARFADLPIEIQQKILTDCIGDSTCKRFAEKSENVKGAMSLLLTNIDRRSLCNLLKACCEPSGDHVREQLLSILSMNLGHITRHARHRLDQCLQIDRDTEENRLRYEAEVRRGSAARRVMEELPPLHTACKCSWIICTVFSRRANLEYLSNGDFEAYEYKLLNITCSTLRLVGAFRRLTVAREMLERKDESRGIPRNTLYMRLERAGLGAGGWFGVGRNNREKMLRLVLNRTPIKHASSTPQLIRRMRREGRRQLGEDFRARFERAEREGLRSRVH